MTATKEATPPLRFRLYYWAMNAAFIWQVGGTILYDFLGFDPNQNSWTIVATSFLIIVFELILMPLLVALPFWRDEYAEILWKRTIYQMATLMAVILPILAIANFSFNVLIDIDNIPAPFPQWYREKLFVEVSLFRALMGVWGNFTLIFVLLFQFNRWRDSRG